MHCPHCREPLAQATPFCPSCGGSLAPAPAVVPAPPPDNVVYLQQTHDPAQFAQGPPTPAPTPAQPAPTDLPLHGVLPPMPGSPAAGEAPPAQQFVDAAASVPPAAPPAPQSQLDAAASAPAAWTDPATASAAASAAGSYVNVLGETVQSGWGGPSAMVSQSPLLPPEIDREPRIVGTLAAMLAASCWLVGVGWWIVALVRDTPSALSGGFVLLAMVAWVWYLTLPPTEQVPGISRWWNGLSARIDRRVLPLRASAGMSMVLRRERERLGHMRRERARRIGELGEATYREFRRNGVPDGLVPHAQRVIAIEQQMLLQDARVGQLDRERDAVRDRHAATGTEPGASAVEQAAPPPRRRRRSRPRGRR